MHCKQISSSTLCLQKRNVFLVILATTVFSCLLSIRYFKLFNVSPRRAAVKQVLVNSLEFEEPVIKLERWDNATSDLFKNRQIDALLRNCVLPDEFRLKFRSCYHASETQNAKCKAVHSNPDSYWRSQNSRIAKSHAEDFKRMDLASRCCAFKYPSLLLNSPRDPPFPWELEYLCGSSPLLDILHTAHASRSTIQLLGATGEENRFFNVGDRVTLEVVVRNGIGQVQKSGGDSVRVWLVTPDLGASIVADVTDLKNGSYRAISVLPWAGKVEVRATIAHTRDLLRTVVYIQRFFTTSHWFTALWSKGIYTEATPCSPYPALPAFSTNEICNLTHRNGGFPWYCGKPIKKELQCSDYVSSRKIDFPSFLPVTAAEEKLIELTESKRPFLIPSKIGFHVQAKPGTMELTLPQPTLPCNKRDMSQTFSETDQSGYLFDHIWRPFACRLPNVTATFLQQCLKDTQVLFLGDSNTRLQMDILTPLVNCANKIPRARNNWHAPLWCDNNSLNISIKYFPPMHPFYGSIGEQVMPEVLRSSVKEMDAIPARGKYIVHLHHFLHFMPFHFGLVEHRLHLLRAATERLLARNPQVIVVYQSAFSSYDHSPKNKHKLNALLVELQRTVMSGLGPRVMFVRTFPITVAIENKSGHPKESNKFMSLYMGHICGR